MMYKNKKSTKNLLENISNHCFNQIVPYTHSKNNQLGSLKYKKGRVCSYQWISQLSYCFFEKEKQLKEEFFQEIKIKTDEIQILKEGDYKRGMRDAFEEVLEQIKENKVATDDSKDPS